MKKYQIERFNSYEQTEFDCKSYQVVWIGNLPFVTAFGVFTGLLADLRAQISIQRENIKGIVLDKAAKRSALDAAMWYICPKVAAFADISGNLTLKSFMITSESRLKKMTEDSITTYAHDVLRKTGEVLGSLAPFGITQDTLDDLEDKITAWTIIKDLPLSAYETKSNATIEIEQLISAINKVLTDQLDLLAATYKVENPEFFSVFSQSRKIKHLPSTTTVLKGVVVDSDTQTPLSDVRILIKPNGLKRKTSSSGAFRIITMPQGHKEIHCSHKDYITQIAPVIIVQGITTEIVVSMVKM